MPARSPGCHDRSVGGCSEPASINQQFLRSALVAGQIAVAFVLLIGAVLLTTSFAVSRRAI